MIIFATKHGATEEIASRIAAQIQSAAMFNVNSKDALPFDDFDCVILGSPVYAGCIKAELKAFIKKHEKTLLGKRLGLFISGLDKSNTEKTFKENFSMAILKHAVSTAFLGGIFDPQKVGGLGRFIMRVAKHKEFTDTIDDEEIKRFAKVFRCGDSG